MSIESFANQHVLELVAYQPGKPIEETARELGLDPRDIVKLASNENPLGPSPRAVEAISRAAAGVNIYPDGAAFRLRSAIAEFCGVDFGQTVVGTGSSEVIELICHALLIEDILLHTRIYIFYLVVILPLGQLTSGKLCVYFCLLFFGSC